MRHQKRTKKFKRTEEERKRLWIDLTQALILEGQITTFTARAKWFKPRFERLVTLVKRANGDVKLAYTKVRPFLSEKVARKLIEEVVPKLSTRNSGYTRLIKLGIDFNGHDKSIVSVVEDAKKPNQKPTIQAEEVKESTPAKPQKKETAKTTKKTTVTKKTTTKKEEK